MQNELFARFAEKQKHVWCCCPRCGCDRMAADVSKNALSRRVDLMICDICGNIEAIEDFPENQKLPLEKWALNEHPDRFFVRGKDYDSFYFICTHDESYPYQNAYIVVEAFDTEDAVKKMIDQFGTMGDNKPRCTSYADREDWLRIPAYRERFRRAGLIRLNDTFEESER